MVCLLFQQIKIYFTESQHDNLSASINNVKPLVEILNPLKTNGRPLYLKAQSVPRCKHFSSRL